jgi:hypothetical protein
MKHLLKSVIATLAVMASVGSLTNVQGAPLLTITDNLDLYVTGQAQAQYNSNVLSAGYVQTAQGSSKDDYVFTLAPGLELDYGRNTDTTITFSYVEDFLWYRTNKALNNNLANVFLNADHVQGAWDLKANLSWQQLYTNTPSTIVKSNVSSAGGKIGYTISPKFNTDLGFQYTGTRYTGALASAYQNLQTYYVPANFYYVYSDKFDIGAIYYLNYQTPQNSNTTAGVTRYDNFIGGTVRIKQWEKLTGSVNLGVDFNHLDQTPLYGTSLPAPAENHTNLGYGVKLQYDFSPKLSLFLNGQRNFQTGALGQNIQVTSMNFSGHYAFSDFVSLDTTFVGWSLSQYYGTPRTDNAYNFGFQANWTPTTYLVLSAGYTYFLNDSNTAGNTYNINLVTISANVRY